MRTNEIVEEDEHGNKVVGRLKRIKTLLGLVPGLELFVKRLDEVVGDIVFERLDADMSGAEHGFYRLFVSGITIRDDGVRFAKMFD